MEKLRANHELNVALRLHRPAHHAERRERCLRLGIERQEQLLRLFDLGEFRRLREAFERWREHGTRVGIPVRRLVKLSER